MSIELTLDIDGTRQSISLDEARHLYMELNQLFASNDSHMINHHVPINERVHEVRREPVSTPETTQATDIHANAKVEAARKRAAARTSGCGARR